MWVKESHRLSVLAWSVVPARCIATRCADAFTSTGEAQVAELKQPSASPPSLPRYRVPCRSGLLQQHRRRGRLSPLLVARLDRHEEYEHLTSFGAPCSFSGRIHHWSSACLRFCVVSLNVSDPGPSQPEKASNAGGQNTHAAESRGAVVLSPLCGWCGSTPIARSCAICLGGRQRAGIWYIMESLHISLRNVTFVERERTHYDQQGRCLALGRTGLNNCYGSRPFRSL